MAKLTLSAGMIHLRVMMDSAAGLASACGGYVPSLRAAVPPEQSLSSVDWRQVSGYWRNGGRGRGRRK